MTLQATDGERIDYPVDIAYNYCYFKQIWPMPMQIPFIFLFFK